MEFSIKENTIFNVSSHTPSPQPTRVAEDLHDSLTKNGTFTFEILHKNGNRFQTRITRCGNGKYDLFSFQDITAHYEKEKE